MKRGKTHKFTINIEDPSNAICFSIDLFKIYFVCIILFQ